jgi:hypothetical protein
VAILFVAALLASCQRSTTTTAVRVDPALATLVPPDATLLVGAKLDKLRETAVYQKHFDQMPLPRLDDFAKQTGLDPRKDVWEMLFASNGSWGVLMARGKFPTSELEPRLEQQGATRTRYKGYSLFGDDRNAAFFMNSSTAIAGSTPALKTIIDNRDRSSGGIPPALQPLVNLIPRASQFWAVFNGTLASLPFPNDSNLGNVNQFIRSVQNGRFSASLTNGLDFQASGTCDTGPGAKQIHDLLKGLIGMGRLSTPDNRPDLLKVYDSIDVQQQGNVVNVSASVPQDVVDKFLNTFVSGRKLQ